MWWPFFVPWRERLLPSGRPFTFAARDTLADLYQNAGVTPDRIIEALLSRVPLP